MLAFFRLWLSKMASLFSNSSMSNNSSSVFSGKATIQIQYNQGPVKVKAEKQPSTVNPESFKSLYPARFIRYHEMTVAREVGDVSKHTNYENNQSDPGGETAWGISAQANPDVLPEIKAGMTKARAENITGWY